MRIMIIAALSLLCVGTASAQVHVAPPGHTVSITCRVGNVGVFQNRVHVRCAAENTPAVVSSGQSSIQAMMNQIQQAANGGGAPTDPGLLAALQAAMQNMPRFFAVGTQAEPALAEHVVQVALEAAAHNRQVEIFYEVRNNNNPPGCAPNDCRRLTGIVMLVAP